MCLESLSKSGAICGTMELISLVSAVDGGRRDHMSDVAPKEQAGRPRFTRAVSESLRQKEARRTLLWKEPSKRPPKGQSPAMVSGRTLR